MIYIHGALVTWILERVSQVYIFSTKTGRLDILSSWKLQNVNIGTNLIKWNRAHEVILNPEKMKNCCRSNRTLPRCLLEELCWLKYNFNYHNNQLLFFKFTFYLFDCFWILITILRGQYPYSYFTNDKTGTQSNKVHVWHHRQVNLILGPLFMIKFTKPLKYGFRAIFPCQGI